MSFERESKTEFLRPITTELIHSSAAFTTTNIKESSSGRKSMIQWCQMYIWVYTNEWRIPGQVKMSKCKIIFESLSNIINCLKQKKSNDMVGLKTYVESKVMITKVVQWIRGKNENILL